KRAKGHVKQQGNHQQGNGKDFSQAALGLFHFAKLASPFSSIALRNQRSNLALGFGYSAGKIALTNAELDGNEPQALLARNHRRTGTKILLRTGRWITVDRLHQVLESAAGHGVG